jgi:TolB-like protein/Tfp pilus assembly protein PilF
MPRMAKPALRGLWGEIRRRHVPRVAAYYIAGAWVVAQAASLLFEAFDAQHYLRYVIGVLVLGLPIALALAWAFDITPRGIERTLATVDAPVADPAPSAQSAPAPERSIAVLPFANLSQDPDNEYFSDGLSEEIRNQLARVPGLQVAARTSSFAFKGRHQDVREIGRLLNVSTLLEGGVRRHANKVRIDLQLVSAANGFQIWSESYERQIDDIFRMQSDIGSAVIAAVTRRHAGPGPALPPPGTSNFDAYNEYLLGRHHFHKRTEQALQRAVGCFERAIALDPEYALAYSGLADASMLLTVRHYGNLSTAQALERAVPAARRALELRPDLAEAHASLGIIETQRGEYAGAEAEFRRARDLNPGYSMAHVWLGLALEAQGRFQEAAESNREAFRLDPLAPIVNCNVAFDALRFGDFELARTRFLAAMDIDPVFIVPYNGMERLHAARGELREALAWNDRALAKVPTRAYFHARRGLLLLQLGEPEAAAASIQAACDRESADVLESELAVALHAARSDRAALERIASGAAGNSFTDAQRAQASLALGRQEQAATLYAQLAPAPELEINDVLSGDWIWRLPHSINHAHLRLRVGDEGGRRALEVYVEGVARFRREGIVNSDLLYRSASALWLLGRQEQALNALEEAIHIGWRHAWWARVDWNFEGLPQDPRGAALLALASGDKA